MKNTKNIIVIAALYLFLTSCESSKFKPAPLSLETPVRGWIILSDNLQEGLKVIDKAPAYDINHLQISHHVIHDLRHVREADRLFIANEMIKRAHANGIQEVVLWDRSLYDMTYYPDQFKTGPGGTIDLDNQEFWEWFKNDYREMLDYVPNIQGLILTFIETGTRVERQHSEILTTNQKKLAAVVNAIADVVIEERGLNLYARTFSYTYDEYENVLGAIDLFENDKIRLMMKETPHDFFLTHPNDFFAGTVARPTIIEFDTGAEFNGQGIIANTWPEHIIDRWSDFLKRNHIIGYTARTDRYGDTRIIGRPSEINLYALKRYFEDQSLQAEDIYDEFISLRYGAESLPYVKPAFKNAFEIVTSALYTLGTSTANHSKLDFDPYRSHWARHLSGKWHNPPVAYVKHGVNRTFHYWTEVANYLAPAWAKAGGTQLNEVPWVVENGWLTQGEMMNEEFLNYIITEKEFGVSLAEQSLDYIIGGRNYLSSEDYEDLYHYFIRTFITAKLHKAVATAYFGFRIYARGKSFQTAALDTRINTALTDILTISELINNFPAKTPAGQWNWVEDAEMALNYYEMITQGTWPERTQSYDTGLNGIKFLHKTL